MPPFWAMRARRASTTANVTVKLGTFTPPRTPNIEGGDACVLFARQAHGVSFWGFGTVAGKPTSQPAPGTATRLTYTAAIGSVSVVSTPLVLEDFKFSLLKVYRFSFPDRHFRRSYVHLDGTDLETLKAGEIHTSRTAVGLVAGALPLESRLRVAADFLDGRTGKFHASYRELLDHVMRHVRDEYAQLATLLVGVAQLGRKLQRDHSLSYIRADGHSDTRVDLLQLAKAAEPLDGTLAEGNSAFEALADQPVPRSVEDAFEVDRREVLRILQVV